MTTKQPPSMSVSLDISASAEELFSHLARPADHITIDGTGMLRATDDVHVLSGVGDVFEIAMFSDQMGEYVMENHVVEFEPDRRIAWEPCLKTTDKPKLQSSVGVRAHHRWGWELTPLLEGGTRVTEFCDLSRAPKFLREATKDGEQWRPAMEASLANLAKLVEKG